MSTLSGSRRLAAVVVIDVVSYSTMMAADEEGTLATLKAHRNETDPILLNHGGRVVKGTGDGLLAEFPSAVEALRAAVEVQRLMAERNAVIPDDRRMQYRIGINLGDVIVDDDGDIYGDGVNVAARLEAAAEPGGICVSESIQRQVSNAVDAEFEPLGALSVKNIPNPIEAWRVGALGSDGPSRTTAQSSYALPSVAVLPFHNLSGEDDQEYFVDGLVEDLITALSRHRDLRIVSRSSTFAYKGHSGDVRDTARELDATYVVEGSGRRAGSRIRITAQLIEAETGHHVWAERYDRELEDIFAVQDEVVDEIASHIHPNVERVQGERLEGASPDELDAWDLAQRAKWHLHTATSEGTMEAIRLLELASQRDPHLGVVFQLLAYAWSMMAFSSWRIPGRDSWEEMKQSAERALEISPSDPTSMTAYAFVQEYSGNLEDAEDLVRRVLQMVPTDAFARHLLGQVRFFRGDYSAAVDHLTEAWRRARHEPWRFNIGTSLAFAHYLAERYDAAVVWAERSLEIADYLQTHLVYAATLGQLGDTKAAERQIAYLTAARPNAVARDFTRNVQWESDAAVVHYHEGLVKAGLPPG